MKTVPLLLSGAAVGMGFAASPSFAHGLGADPAWLSGQVQEALGKGWLGGAGLALGAVALGALHGLEPGHAKTMMALS